MILHEDGHVDHVSREVLVYVLGRFHDRESSFVATIELPEFLGTVECRLYGTRMGDPPVVESEVRYGARGGRAWLSRVVDRPARQTRRLTVVAGPHQGHDCVLYTVYGGPYAPREPLDPGIASEAERSESLIFWAQHALAI